MNHYEFHEFANIFPMLDGEELENLRADIEKHGLVEPIVLYEGKILDGRNRATACEALGIEPVPVVEYTGDDPVAYVVSKNLKRRHLNESQRAMVAAKLANLPVGWNGRNSYCANLRNKNSMQHDGGCANLRTLDNPCPNKQAADAVNVSERSVVFAKKILNEGTPELVEAVETGKIAVSAAANFVKQAPEQQKETVAKIVSGEAQSAAKASREKKPVYVDPADDEPPGGWAPQKFQSAQGIYDVFVLDVLYEFSEEELAAWSLPAADDCHLWLWTAHEHLPIALRVLEAWGFQYEHIFAWYKNNVDEFGIDESRLYPCEFALYARRGNPQFATTERVMTGVYTSGGANLGKPDAFYDLVKQSTTGRRADICGSRNIEGFDLCGSEGLTKE